jgi:hypothetical protein
MRLRVRVLLFFSIILLGVFARTWEIRSLPPGLNADEASSGVDAFSLYRHGMDRNGVSYPVYMTSWGSGQNALNAYVMIPFIALGGLNPFTVRLPALLAGILALPLVYFIGKRTAGEDFALSAMFLLAISPWHILESRWGFEGNLLPFIFAAAYLLLLKSAQDRRWLIPSMLLMGLCLYTYGPAYAAVPLFLLFGLPVLIQSGKLRLADVLAGLAALLVISLPIALFLLVNMLGLDTLHLGSISVPRLPAQPRYETISAVFQHDAVHNLFKNLTTLLNLLWVQEDGFFFNTVPPYGYLYAYTLPLAAVGAVLLFAVRPAHRTPERKLLLAWLAACLLVGILETVNIGRINLIFIPLTFCVAALLAWLAEHSKLGLWLVVAVCLAAFALFSREYHGREYRAIADREFSAGLLPAIDFASLQGQAAVCITRKVNMPYIYVLFSQRLDPAHYLPAIKYANPHGIFRQVVQLDRYSFGLNSCPHDPRTVYVLSGETPPLNGASYDQSTFGRFSVYVPSRNP